MADKPPVPGPPPPFVPTQQLAIEPVVPIPVPQAAPQVVDPAKQKPKIMQIFLEDKLSGKMKTVVLRSNDRVWQLMDSVGADRVKYKTRLFAGEVELTDELGKTLLDARVPDNSTVHYLLEPLFVDRPAVRPPPQEEAELIPCEICHGAYPLADFQQHAPCFNDNPPPARPARAAPAQQAAAPVPAEDAVPCERCNKPVAFSQYMDHVNTCGFT